MSADGSTGPGRSAKRTSTRLSLARRSSSRSSEVKRAWVTSLAPRAPDVDLLAGAELLGGELLRAHTEAIRNVRAGESHLAGSLQREQPPGGGGVTDLVHQLQIDRLAGLEINLQEHVR